MKFTYEDLAKVMGLKVGDRIKCNDKIYVLNNNYMLHNEEEYNIYILYLIDKDFEILRPKKKVGDLSCGDFELCVGCPLTLIHNCNIVNSTLYNKLNAWFEKYYDQEIYDIMKKRLDKEVEEDE